MRAVWETGRVSGVLVFQINGGTAQSRVKKAAFQLHLAVFGRLTAVTFGSSQYYLTIAKPREAPLEYQNLFDPGLLFPRQRFSHPDGLCAEHLDGARRPPYPHACSRSPGDF